MELLLAKTHTYTHIRTHIHTHARTHACTHARMCACTPTHTHPPTHTHTPTHPHTHTHTHTHHRCKVTWFFLNGIFCLIMLEMWKLKIKKGWNAKGAGRMNALFSFSGYERELLTALPQLQTLNSQDRQGRRALPSDMVNDVPGRSLTIWGFTGLVFRPFHPTHSIFDWKIGLLLTYPWFCCLILVQHKCIYLVFFL